MGRPPPLPQEHFVSGDDDGHDEPVERAIF